MTARRLFAAVPLLALAVLLGTHAGSQGQDKDNPAAKPLNRDNARHKQFLEIVAKGKADVIFIGDTITVETTVLEARRSKSRPTVGIVLFEHVGRNQRREVVCRAKRNAMIKARTEQA